MYICSFSVNRVIGVTLLVSCLIDSVILSVCQDTQIVPIFIDVQFPILLSTNLRTPNLNIFNNYPVSLCITSRSLSYVTTLACFAFVLLVLVYYTIDVKKWWSGAPFYYTGEHFCQK